MSTPEDRAAWVTDLRKVLEVIGSHPDLPLPYASSDGIVFFLLDTIGSIGAPRILADAEAALTEALGVTFTGRHGDEGKTGESNYYLLEARLENGTPLTIKAWDTSVAESRVTGTRVVEDVEWVRLPAEAAEPDQDDEGTEGTDAS